MANVYNVAKDKLSNGDWADWDLIVANDLGVLLLDDSGGTAVYDATDGNVADVLAPVTNVEVTVGDISAYVRKPLSNTTITPVGNVVEHRADATLFATLGVSGGLNLITHAIVYFLGVNNVFTNANDATSNLPIAFIALASPVTTNGGDVTIQWDAVADGAVFNYTE